MTARETVLFAVHHGPEVRDVPRREAFPALDEVPASDDAESDEDAGDGVAGTEPDDEAASLAATAGEAAPWDEDAAWEEAAPWDEVDSAPHLSGAPRLDSAAGPAVRLRKGMDAPVSLAVTYGEVVASCLDGIALGGRHRALLPRAGRPREEERILAFVDALVVTPRFPTALVAWWNEAAELPDPWKVWAPVLALSCLDGDDVPTVLGAILGRLHADEAEAALIAGEALAVGAHRERLEWALSLAADPHPGARAAALEARSLAGALSAGELVRIVSADTTRSVRISAARAAARLPHDPRIDELLLAELHRAADPDLAWEVVRALALRGLPAGYFAMKHDPGLMLRLGARALDVLALFGDESDATLARQVTGRCGITSQVLRGLGRYGHPGAAPLLLRALGNEDAAEEASAALVWLFGLPFDERNALSPEAWRTWIREADLDEGVRYRFGRPYSPACVAGAAADTDELCSQADLAWLVDEANVRSGLTERPELWRWSPAAHASLTPSLGAFARAAEAFAADSWRSLGRERRRRG